MKRVAFLAVLALASVALASAYSQVVGQARQTYGPWQFNKDKNYYYRTYDYKVKATDANYQQEYCIYFKNDAKVTNKWVYFYNPKTEKYWGRYPTVNNDPYKKIVEKGGEAWSILPAEYRQKDIYQIQNTSWPAPKTDYCPPIPGAKDGVLIQAPPADLP